MRTIVILSLCLMVAAQQGYNLVWSDEFDGNSLDLSKWQYEINCDGGGNAELQCYTNQAQNVAVRNGNLYVTATPQNYNGKQYTSGRINTAGKAGWKYGRFDIRAKLPSGPYLWPALWMMPRDSVYGWWAASGEIDIMEARGQSPSLIESTLHHGASWPNNIYTGSGPRDMGVDLTADFHVYSCVWTDSQIQFFMDGNNYYTLNLDRSWWSGQGTNPYTANKQPFDQYFFFIINLAVGGYFFGGNANALTLQQAQSWASPSLIVDYVRVYQLSNNVVTPPAPVASVATPAFTGTSASCTAMFNAATCRTTSQDPSKVDPNAVAGARGWLCGAYPQYCANIQNGGQYASCNNVEQLSNAMSIYYNAFASQGASACNFGGLAVVNSAAAAATPAAPVTPATSAAAAAAPVTSNCQAMFNAATCRTASNTVGQVDANSVAGARGWLCGAYPQYCANIQNGGQYASCNPLEQLSNAMSLYYNDFKTTQGASACNFSGLAQINSGAVASPAPTTAAAAAATPASSAAAAAAAITCNGAGCGAGLCNCNGACYLPTQYCCPSGSLVQKAFC